MLQMDFPYKTLAVVWLRIFLPKQLDYKRGSSHLPHISYDHICHTLHASFSHFTESVAFSEINF